MKKEADKALKCVFEEGLSHKDKDFNSVDGVILGLFDNLIGHADSISILLKPKHTASVDSILRTLFENYVYLTFILDKDTEKRATSYAVAGKAEEYLMYDMISEDSNKGKKIRDFIGLNNSGDLNRKYEQHGISKEEINQTYLTELGMSRLEQKWYNLYPELKLTSFKKLSIYCDMEAQYNVVYRILSREVHGGDALHRFELKSNFVGIKKTKHQDTKLHENIVKLFLLESIRKIYMHYGLKKQLKSFNTLIELNVNYSKKEKLGIM
jgi:hypothetical protein